MTIRSCESHRVRGLDALRFIAAAVVLLGHGGAFPVDALLSKDTSIGFLVLGVYGNLFYGPAAVIVFFVVSGFCIHFPYRDLSTRLGLRYFYVGRFTRIGIPVAVMAVLYGKDLARFNDSILWSLAAELIYYSLYPVLRAGFSRFGIRAMIAVSYACAVTVVLISPDHKYLADYGTSLTWILGLPSWLLGCLAAEKYGNVRVPSIPAIWTRRLEVVLCMLLASVLQFHSPVGDPWTLPVFPVLAYVWLNDEVAYFNASDREPWSWLESGGVWSYSLYLVHLPVLLALREFAPMDATPVEFLAIFSNWAIKVTGTLFACWIFYRAVERSAHKLARRLRSYFPQYKIAAPPDM